MNKVKYFCFLLVFGFVSFFSNTYPQQQNCADDHSFFIENKGQWPAEVKFLSRTGGADAWITAHGIVYDFYKMSGDKKGSGPGSMKVPEALSGTADGRTADASTANSKNVMRRSGQVVRVDLLGAEAQAENAGLEKKNSYYNYFLGNDPSKWAANVSLYGNVVVRNVYDNIDVRYYFDEGRIRYDYVVNPGADVSRIRMKITGAENAEVVNNELVIRTSIGEVRHSRLRTYQHSNGANSAVDGSSAAAAGNNGAQSGIVDIESSFIKYDDGTFGFRVGNYDASKQLVIDPLVFSAVIAGSGDESANAISLDGSGNIVVAGTTTSTNFPTTAGAYDQSQNGLYDAFVSKMNPAGTALLWSTFLGGSNYDYGYAMTMDASGFIYLSGAAASSNFPVTSSAYDQSHNGDYDAFVTKLAPEGSSILWSTFVGGTGTDYATAIGLDGAGNAYITGITKSSNFPVSGTAYDQSYNAGKDVFAAKISSSGSALTYSTFLGGAQDDVPYAIAVDAMGYAYIAGSTLSADFPVTSAAYDMSQNGSADAFIAKVGLSGSTLAFSTFLGGSGFEEAYGITLDASKNIYVTGATSSANFPITLGSCYNQTLNGDYDAFAVKLDPGGSSLTYSTYLGGAGTDYGDAVKTDASGNAFITGMTASAAFPYTDLAYSKSLHGTKDAFISEISATGASLTYSTFLGGAADEEATAFVLSGTTDIIATGFTTSSDYPISAGALTPVSRGAQDVFVTKLNWSGGNNNGQLSLVYNQIDAGGFPFIQSYVTVTDQSGQTIAGLTSSNFTVKEDGVIQSPISVTPVGAGSSISVALVLDRSGSMDGQPINDAKSAASQFVDQMQTGDNGAVISFSSDVTIDQPYTTDKAALKNSISLLTASGSTAMYDALYQALNVTQLRTGRKAIIVMTDGGDNASLHSQEEVISYAKKFSIPVFTIGLGTSVTEDSLKKIAQETGGQYYAAPGSSDLAAIYTKISQQLNTQYLVTYTTKNTACGGAARTVNIAVSYNSLTDSKNKLYTPPACNSTASIKPVSPLTVNAGTEFTVDILVGDPVKAENLFGLSFHLNFDPKYLIYLTAEDGGWFGINTVMNRLADQVNGFVSLGISRQYPATGLNGSGVALRVKFRASASITKSTAIKFFFSNLSATDANGGTITLKADTSTTNINAALTVWPGDTNNDGKVDQSDVLPLGTYWLTTGPVRTGASMQWTGQSSQLWTPAAAVYADATGDGKVDQTEVLAIGLNWSKTHTLSASDINTPIYRGGTGSGTLAESGEVSETAAGHVSSSGSGNHVRSMSTAAYRDTRMNPGNNHKALQKAESGSLYMEESYTEGGERIVTINYQQTSRSPIRPHGISFALKYGEGIKITGAENGQLFGGDVISIWRDNGSEKTLGFGITNKKGNAQAALSGSVARIKFRVEPGAESAKITLEDIKAQDVEGVELNVANGGMLTAADRSTPAVPGEFCLKQNYPNPFNPVTVIEYTLPEESNVKLTIYNMLGEEVKTLINERQAAGMHQVSFDASGMASGTYVYKIAAGTKVAVRKCVIMK